MQPTATKRNYKILIIEDVSSWQKAFKRYLKDEPFDIFIATNYEETLALAEAYSFDLLILDINLSGVPHNIDGLRVANKILQKNNKVKVVIVSGIDEPHKSLRSANFEPTCVLEKRNLDQDELIRKVYQALA